MGVGPRQVVCVERDRWGGQWQVCTSKSLPVPSGAGV